MSLAASPSASPSWLWLKKRREQDKITQCQCLYHLRLVHSSRNKGYTFPLCIRAHRSDYSSWIKLHTLPKCTTCYIYINNYYSDIPCTCITGAVCLHFTVLQIQRAHSLVWQLWTADWREISNSIQVCTHMYVTALSPCKWSLGFANYKHSPKALILAFKVDASKSIVRSMSRSACTPLRRHKFAVQPVFVHGGSQCRQMRHKHSSGHLQVHMWRCMDQPFFTNT